MFERFSERARQVVVLAQDEARALRHNYIGTEHLLLGLLRDDEGVAARVLDALDVTVEEARAQVERIVSRGDHVTTGMIPFTPRAKKVLELALREALSLGDLSIETEHILLGVARENDGVAARVLLHFGIDADKVRTELVRVRSELRQPLEDEFDPTDVRAWADIGVEPPSDVVPAANALRSERAMVLGWILFGIAFALGLGFGWVLWG